MRHCGQAGKQVWDPGFCHPELTTPGAHRPVSLFLKLSDKVHRHQLQVPPGVGWQLCAVHVRGGANLAHVWAPVKPPSDNLVSSCWAPRHPVIVT